MKNHQLKSTSIVLRVTPPEKAALKEKAAQSGLSLTDYLLKKAQDRVVISPLLAREALQVLHAIHLQLQHLQNQHTTVNEIQDALTNYTHLLHDHMRTIKSKLTGGLSACQY